MPVPDYILRLREKVGHDLLWLPGVTAVVLRDAELTSDPDLRRGSEVLLVKRSDNGNWGPVTGIVDPGEHPAECAVREVLEEAEVEAVVEALVSVSVTAPVVYPNGDRAQYLDHTFRCRYTGGTAAVGDDESTEVAWFPLDAMPDLPTQLAARIQAALRPPHQANLHP